MDHFSVFLNKPTDEPGSDKAEVPGNDPIPLDPMSAQIDTIMQAWDGLKAMIVAKEAKSDKQHDDLKVMVSEAAVDNKIELAAFDKKLDNQISNTHIRLAGLEGTTRGFDTRVDLHEISTRQEVISNLDKRMSTTENTLDNIQTTLSELVSTKGSS